MRALRADLQVGVEVLLVERLAAVGALDPHALRDAARLLCRSDGFGNALEPGHDGSSRRRGAGTGRAPCPSTGEGNRVVRPAGERKGGAGTPNAERRSAEVPVREGRPSRPSASPLARHVVLRALLHVLDLAQQVLDVLVVPVEVERRGLDDQQGRAGVVEEEMVEGVVEFRDVLLVVAAALGRAARAVAQPLAQPVGGALQVDDDVGRGEIAREQVVEALVDEQLVVVERQVREDLVLVEQVVAHRRLAEEIALPQRVLLPMAREQVEELGLERRAAAAGPPVGRKRVLDVVEDEAGVEPLAEALREHGLADAWRALDREVARVHDGAQYTDGLRKPASRAC